MVEVKNIAENYFAQLKNAIEQVNPHDIQEIADVLYKAYQSGKNIFLIGNGGSASSASHMAIDFGKGSLNNFYDKREKRVKVISLTDNVAAITAISNDLSYEDVFVEQLHNLLNPGDVVIGISASGNSSNIIKALMHAKQSGAVTVGFLGFHNGGMAKEFTDYNITIQSNHYGIVEDLHMSLGHILTDCLAHMKKATPSPSNLDKKTSKVK